MGSGAVIRYLATYGSERVRKAALFGAIPPFLLKTDDNPEGVDGKVFADIKAAIASDRYAYFENFLNNFYNVDVLGLRSDQRPSVTGEFQRGGRQLTARDLRVRRHLADRLPRRLVEDKRSCACSARHRRSHPLATCNLTNCQDAQHRLRQDHEYGGHCCARRIGLWTDWVEFPHVHRRRSWPHCRNCDHCAVGAPLIIRSAR